MGKWWRWSEGRGRLGPGRRTAALALGTRWAHIHLMSKYVDYWVDLKRRSRLPKPYTWEIRSSGRGSAVMRNYVPFKNAVMARISGERALKRLLQKLNA
jgi:hypothetical protein